MDEIDVNERTCRWCDALGHDYEDDAYCPAGKPAGWFDPVYDLDLDVPPGGFGNETACGNCGDEWSALDSNSLCGECAEVLNEADKTEVRW